MARDWRDAFPQKWLKAEDFPKPRLLVISVVRDEEIGSTDKKVVPVVYFENEEKGLVLNITNGNSIQEIAGGSANPDDWPGAVIVGFATETDYQGKRVPCIRIRKPKHPPATVPAEEHPPDPVTTDDDDVPF